MPPSPLPVPNAIRIFRPGKKIETWLSRNEELENDGMDPLPIGNAKPLPLNLAFAKKCESKVHSCTPKGRFYIEKDFLKEGRNFGPNYTQGHIDYK